MKEGAIKETLVEKTCPGTLVIISTRRTILGGNWQSRQRGRDSSKVGTWNQFPHRHLITWTRGVLHHIGFCVCCVVVLVSVPLVMEVLTWLLDLSSLEDANSQTPPLSLPGSLWPEIFLEGSSSLRHIISFRRILDSIFWSEIMCLNLFRCHWCTKNISTCIYNGVERESLEKNIWI